MKRTESRKTGKANPKAKGSTDGKKGKAVVNEEDEREGSSLSELEEDD